LNKNVEYNNGVPSPKGWSRQLESMSPPPHYVQSDGHDKGEKGTWVDLQIGDYIRRQLVYARWKRLPTHWLD